MKPAAEWSLLAVAVILAVAGAGLAIGGAIRWPDYATVVAVEVMVFGFLIPNRYYFELGSLTAIGLGYLAPLALFPVDGPSLHMQLIFLVLFMVAVSHVHEKNSLMRRNLDQEEKLIVVEEALSEHLSDLKYHSETVEESAARNVELLEQIEEAKSRSEEQSTFLRGVLDSISQGVLVFDRNRKLSAWNAQVVELQDFPGDFLRAGMAIDEIIRFNAEKGAYGDGDAEEIVADMLSKVETFGDSRGERYERMVSDGRALQVNVEPVVGGGFVQTFSDITDFKKAEKAIRRLAMTDPLTGIANRASFTAALRAALAAAESDGETVALALLDLDGFKPINDSFGHPVGDATLKYVAKVLETTIRSADMAARLGGDEFAIIFRQIADRKGVIGATERIIDKLSRPFTVCDQEITIGASAGIGLFPEDGRTVDALIKSVDDALYRAKAAGKGRLHRASA